MSGGSFNYLCFADAGELVDYQKNTELQWMADALAELGYADDVAKETMELLLEIRAVRNRLNSRISRVSDVWKAMEWWKSNDWNEDQFKKALAEYRGEE